MADIDLTGLIGREPEEIVEFFEEKGYAISWSWRDTWREANAKAFTVAGAMKLDVLQTIRSSVEDALREGMTFREFQRELEPELRKLGWWGRREIVNEETGEIQERQLGSPWRLTTIYRTNLQTSYMAGRWKSQRDSAREFLRYIAILDGVTRPSHRARHGVVLRKDDPWWDENYPPNGWGCRCRTQSLSARQVEARGYDVRAGDEFEGVAEEGWDYHPGKAAFEPDLSEYDDDLANQYRDEHGG